MGIEKKFACDSLIPSNDVRSYFSRFFEILGKLLFSVSYQPRSSGESYDRVVYIQRQDLRDLMVKDL